MYKSIFTVFGSFTYILGTIKAFCKSTYSTKSTVSDRRSRILEVVIVRRLITWVLGIWNGGGLGRGLGKGRSVYKQPEPKATGAVNVVEQEAIPRWDV
jgi:hypothetical protein